MRGRGATTTRASSRRRHPGRALLAAVLATAAVLIAASAVGVGGGELPELSPGPPASDAFAYDPERHADLEQRAAAGAAQVVYANSPGGATATAERVARWRDQIDSATEGTDVDPDLLEAMVYLESAGRPEVIAGRDPEAASGLVQILASTAQDLLRMEVDLERSRELTRQARRALRRGDSERVERLLRRREGVDERFDPGKALAGAVRYLEIAQQRFGAEDLSVVSYHMGIGNLESVIEAYTSEHGEAGELVADHELTYARLFFDSSPARNEASWELLAGFGDESSEYYWKVLASREIMRLYRTDRRELRRRQRLHGEKATAEEIFHPRGQTRVFDDPRDLRGAWRDGELVPLPVADELGYTLHERLGEFAPEVDADPALYRALRPEALAVLIRIAGWVRDLNGGEGSLIVTSAVRDRAYQDRLRAQNAEATDQYSLHTTGWSFDVLREYESDRQAEAFQFVLDRLQALAVIDYAVEPSAIHVTVSERPPP